jgi:hypothetical protein
MKTKLSIVFALLGCASLGMGGKPPVAVRFFVEANAQDTDRFASPIKLQNPPREAYIEKVPSISERMIKAIYPFQAANGTWGCAFKLDEGGRLNLEAASATRRGNSMVAFVGTKTGTHQVVDMLIDKPIHDGVITIPYGLTEIEIAALSKEFPVLGQKKKK